MRRVPWPETVLFALTVAWGLSFVVIRLALPGVGVLTLTALRMTVGVAFLLLLKPSAFRASPLEWRAGLLGGLLLSGGYLLQTAGMVEAASGKSGFLTAFYVCLVPVVEGLVYRRSPPRRDLVALLVATAGIALMVISAKLTISFGEALVLASALFWAAQIVVVGRVTERTDPVRLAAVQLLVVAVVAAAGVAFVAEPALRWTSGLVWTVLFLGIATNALGFVGQAWAQRRVPPTRTAVLFSPEPVFAALFGLWIAGEAFTVRDAAGAALVLAAVAIAVFGRREAAGG